MARSEVLAAVAIAHVELTSDDRKPHGMGAVEQLAVFDGVTADVGGKVAGAAPVPALFVNAFSCQLTAIASQLRAVG